MITNEDIVSISQNILSTMLKLEAIPCVPLPSEKRIDRITGCIQISGEWKGAIILQSSEELARTFASRLLDENPAKISEEDLRDAFAEMTNMIGGNIKGQVPCPSFLSIPSVTTGQDFDFHLAGATVIRDLALECDGEILRIVMCEENRTQPSLSAQRKLDTAK
ncbi:MAG: chemotaxis protein CheX [Pirellulaceae bacterium]|nr:chemotaxis protein CheX [Pirellulaceae bacterium]